MCYELRVLLRHYKTVFQLYYIFLTIQKDLFEVKICSDEPSFIAGGRIRGLAAAQPRLLPSEAGPGEGGAPGQVPPAPEADRQGGEGDRRARQGHPAHEDLKL